MSRAYKATRTVKYTDDKNKNNKTPKIRKKGTIIIGFFSHGKTLEKPIDFLVKSSNCISITLAPRFCKVSMDQCEVRQLRGLLREKLGEYIDLNKLKSCEKSLDSFTRYMQRINKRIKEDVIRSLENPPEKVRHLYNTGLRFNSRREEYSIHERKSEMLNMHVNNEVIDKVFTPTSIMVLYDSKNPDNIGFKRFDKVNGTTLGIEYDKLADYYRNIVAYDFTCDNPL